MGPYLRLHFGLGGSASPEAMEDARADLRSLGARRRDLGTPVHGLEGQIAALRQYFRMLCAAEVRFPISKAKEHVNKLAFSWGDSFRGGTRKDKQHNINFEKAAVMFNLGALLSQQGKDQDLDTDEGVKVACRCYQEAAGVFAHLREHVSLKVDAPRPEDVSPEGAGMMEKIFLGQAQECFHFKAARDGKSPAILAKLAKHAALLYGEAHKLASSAVLTKALASTTYPQLCEIKAAILAAEAEESMAALHRAREEIGPEVARLRAADAALEGVRRKAKGLAVSAQLEELVARVGRAREKAERENNSVYLEQVPKVEALEAVKPAAMVKALAPEGLDGASDPETASLFAGLVPEQSTKALSRYSEMVDSLIADEKRKLDDLADEAGLRLQEKELPDLLHALEPGRPLTVPEPLASQLAALERGGFERGLDFFEDLFRQVVEVREVTRELLESAQADMDVEAREDAEMRASLREKWTAPPSATLSTVLCEKALGYRENLMTAEQNDSALSLQYRDLAPAFAGLSAAKVAASMPRIEAPALLDGDAGSTASSLRATVDGLSECRTRGLQLARDLDAARSSDDMFQKLMVQSGGYDELFQGGLEKFEPLKERGAAAAARQGELLGQLSAQHEEFLAAHDIQGWRVACAAHVRELQAHYASHEQLMGNIKGGLGFYTSLQDAVRTLKQQCADFCYTRRVQRRELYDELTRQKSEAERRAADEQYARLLQKKSEAERRAADEQYARLLQRQGSSGQYSYTVEATSSEGVAPAPPPAYAAPPPVFSPAAPAATHVAAPTMPAAQPSPSPSPQAAETGGVPALTAQLHSGLGLAPPQPGTPGATTPPPQPFYQPPPQPQYAPATAAQPQCQPPPQYQQQAPPAQPQYQAAPQYQQAPPVQPHYQQVPQAPTQYQQAPPVQPHYQQVPQAPTQYQQAPPAQPHYQQGPPPPPPVHQQAQQQWPGGQGPGSAGV